MKTLIQTSVTEAAPKIVNTKLLLNQLVQLYFVIHSPKDCTYKLGHTRVLQRYEVTE